MMLWGWRCSSTVEYLPSMHQALGLICGRGRKIFGGYNFHLRLKTPIEIAKTDLVHHSFLYPRISPSLKIEFNPFPKSFYVSPSNVRSGWDHQHQLTWIHQRRIRHWNSGSPVEEYCRSEPILQTSTGWSNPALQKEMWGTSGCHSCFLSRTEWIRGNNWCICIV